MQHGRGGIGKTVVGNANGGVRTLADFGKSAFERDVLDGEVVGRHVALHFHHSLQAQGVPTQSRSVYPFGGIVYIKAVGVFLIAEHQALACGERTGVIEYEVCFARNHVRLFKFRLIPAFNRRGQVHTLSGGSAFERGAQRDVPVGHALGATHSDFRHLCPSQRFEACGGYHGSGTEASGNGIAKHGRLMI